MVTSDTYEFKVISSFCKQLKNKNGEDYIKIVKPVAIYKLQCLITDISSVTEAFNNRGDIAKNKCYIYHRDYKDLLVKGGYESICKIVFPEEENKKIGYGGSK